MKIISIVSDCDAIDVDIEKVTFGKLWMIGEVVATSSRHSSGLKKKKIELKTLNCHPSGLTNENIELKNRNCHNKGLKTEKVKN